MWPDHVVVDGVKRDGTGMVLQLLREGVGQPSEATHAHSHREVVALDIAGRDVGGVRLTLDLPVLAADALRGAVALLGLGRLTSSSLC